MADNQEAIFNQMVKYECAIGLQDLVNASPDEISKAVQYLIGNNHIQQQQQRQASVLDGQSGKRILAEINKLAIKLHRN
jgi:hypothetical protein